MGTLQDLKYKVQEIMTEKDEEVSAIDAYIEQLISTFDSVFSSFERVIPLLADSVEAESIGRDDQ